MIGIRPLLLYPFFLRRRVPYIIIALNEPSDIHLAGTQAPRTLPNRAPVNNDLVTANMFLKQLRSRENGENGEWRGEEKITL